MLRMTRRHRGAFRFFILLFAWLLIVPGRSQAADSKGVDYWTPDGPPTLLIGIIPEQNIFKQRERYGYLADYLKEKSGITINITSLSDYGNILDNFTGRHMDGAFFGSFTGALAHERINVEAIAHPVNSDGKSTYRGYLFVRKNSGILGVKQMKGKVMAFVDRASSCGYFFPLAYLRDRGVTDYKQLFHESFFAGSHDAAIDAVLNGDADVGVAKNTVYDALKKENPRIDAELSILATSPEYPSHGFFIRQAVPAAIREKIRAVLLSMHEDTAGQRALEKFGAVKFVPLDTHRDYQSVFDTVRRAGIDLKTYKYRNE